MLHELGHLLGLFHADGLACSTGPGSADFATATGIMSSLSWYTRTRTGPRYLPDDLRGLDWLFSVAPPGPAEPPSQPGEPYAGPPFNTAWSIMYYETIDEGQNWGLPQTPPFPDGLDGTTTRVGVSSATDGSGFQAVTVGGGPPNYPVHVLTRSNGGFHQQTLAETTVPGSSSRYPAGVAYGGDRLAVAWMAQSTSSYYGTLSWGINDREISIDNWVATNLPTQDNTLLTRIIRQDLGLGYGPASGVFVLAAISSVEWTIIPNDPRDGVPWIFLINPDDGSLLTAVDLRDVGTVHSIGKPVCHSRAPDTTGSMDSCVLPVSRITSGGPNLTTVAFDIEFVQRDPPVLDVILGPIQPWDGVALGVIDNAGSGVEAEADTIFGTFTSFREGLDPWFATFDTTTVEPGLGVTPIDLEDLGTAPGELGEPLVPSWSSSLGSRRIGNQAVVYSVWRVEPEQADQSDDGTTGDGDTGTGTAGDETSGVDLGGSDGCQCEAGSPSGKAVPFGLGVLLIIGGRRRRRDRR
jgi:MYXO-CTERM domain-containing protein